MILRYIVCELSQRNDTILALVQSEGSRYASLSGGLLKQDLLSCIIKLDSIFNLIHLKYNEADLDTLIFVWWMKDRVQSGIVLSQDSCYFDLFNQRVF